MVNRCWVRECPERKSAGDNLSFFTFPRNEQMKKLWLKTIDREDREPPKHARICQKHFTKNCFNTNAWSTKKSLKPDAVPSILKIEDVCGDTFKNSEIESVSLVVPKLEIGIGEGKESFNEIKMDPLDNLEIIYQNPSIHYAENVTEKYLSKNAKQKEGKGFSNTHLDSNPYNTSENELSNENVALIVPKLEIKIEDGGESFNELSVSPIDNLQIIYQSPQTSNQCPGDATEKIFPKICVKSENEISAIESIPQVILKFESEIEDGSESICDIDPLDNLEIAYQTPKPIQYPGDVIESEIKDLSPKACVKYINLLRKSSKNKDAIIRRLHLQNVRQSKRIQQLLDLLTKLQNQNLISLQEKFCTS